MEKDNTEDIGKLAATLALVEIGLGSFLHTFKVPLSGHLLSINQIAILSRSCFKLKSPRASLEISFVASLLKSLSPAGKKLTPMLAIASQGILYYFGILFLGLNSFGLLLAVLLSSSWAFLQPVLFIYILFGKTSIAVAEHFFHEVEKFFPNAHSILLWVILGLFILKCALAYFFSYMAIRVSDEHFYKYEQRMLPQAKVRPRSNKSALHLSLHDLFNPLFIFSFLLTIAFFIFSNSTLAETIWGLLRPLALGFIIFYVFRVYPIEKLSVFLHQKGFTRMSKMLNHAISIIREHRNP
ncbi:MAG: hypothetical protein ACXVLQ_14340 [Bacteriovorax sp.]